MLYRVPMKSKHPITLFLMFFLLTCRGGIAQNFSSKRALEVNHTGWNRFSLPAELEAKCRTDMADLRILAIKKNGDTMEAPYTLRYWKHETSKKNIPLNILNQTQKGSSYFYTFENSAQHKLEKIELTFSPENFEYRVVLEGSHDQIEWFTILKEYRILAMHNDVADFSFTTLLFPATTFSYFRLRVPATGNPGLTKAVIPGNGAGEGTFQPLNIIRAEALMDPVKKQTIYTVTLPEKLPVSNLRVFTSGQGDYVRSGTVLSLAENMGSAAPSDTIFIPCSAIVLSNPGANSFSIPRIRTRQIRLIVENGDNEPLQIDSMRLSIRQQPVWVQLPEAGKYLIAYGNKYAKFPKYDAAEVLLRSNPIIHEEYSIGNEEPYNTGIKAARGSWIENKLFLYILMAVIIALLGYFSISMMRKKH